MQEFGTKRVLHDATKNLSPVGVNDQHGRLASHYDARTTETCARVWTYTYDTKGRLTAQRYPTGREVLCTYAGADPDRPSKIEVKRKVSGTWQTDTVADTITYGPRGELRRVLLGNYAVNEYEWDLSGAPKARCARDSGPFASRPLAGSVSLACGSSRRTGRRPAPGRPRRSRCCATSS